MLIAILRIIMEKFGLIKWMKKQVNQEEYSDRKCANDLTRSFHNMSDGLRGTELNIDKAKTNEKEKSGNTLTNIGNEVHEETVELDENEIDTLQNNGAISNYKIESSPHKKKIEKKAISNSSYAEKIPDCAKADSKKIYTKETAFQDINETQDFYVNELITMMEDEHHKLLKQLNFTSATGTGKTKMMSKLINRFPNDYFIVTTQSRGQLNRQINKALQEDCKYNNFNVYGLMDYRVNSILTGENILSKIPDRARCIWLRDEGHIATNNYERLLAEKCYKVINFSATNKRDDIRCNFAHTMMLRTVNQQTGTPEDAINILLKVKEIHRNVANYNPCAIFRCVQANPELYDRIVKACKDNDLKYIDLSEELDYDMAALCEDDSEYDVIINKMKIVEGIDIRRAHVLYMDNQPNNDATTIQVIGRCRRNALLYRNDIDILSPDNKELLAQTRECYVIYNVKQMKIATDSYGDLYSTFCPYISCQALKSNVTINVVDGKMPNGLSVIELKGQTGEFAVEKDIDTGFNVISPATDFYKTIIQKPEEYAYFDAHPGYKKIKTLHLVSLMDGNRAHGAHFYLNENTYRLKDVESEKLSISCERILKELQNQYCSRDVLEQYLSNRIVNNVLESATLNILTPTNINEYLSIHKNLYDYLIEKVTGFNDAPDFVQILCIDKYIRLSNSNNYQIDIKYLYRDLAADITSTIKAITKISPKDNIDKYKIAEMKFRGGLRTIYNSIDEINEYEFPDILCCVKYNQKVAVKKDDIVNWFNKIKLYLEYLSFYYTGNINDLINFVTEKINNTCTKLDNSQVSTVEIDYSALCEDITLEEHDGLRNGSLNTVHHVTYDDILRWKRQYTAIINDRESAIIGTDIFKPIKIKEMVGMHWVESRAVTSKMDNYNKLSSFIQDRYASELKIAEPFLFSGKNNYKLNKKCNSMLGYCVEYYSKYLVYGEEYMLRYINSAASEAKREGVDISSLNDSTLIVRACMLQYRENMKRCYGETLGKLIQGATVTSLIKPDFQYFIDLVVKLGTQTAEYVKNTLYKDVPSPSENVEPNLSIKHIAGLADYITRDTILDVKVTNRIDTKYIKQVLAYHYLSTKRDDVNINRVIVYDATSNKAVVVPISEKNILPNKISTELELINVLSEL